ncbi:MAG: 2OG-Fe(II) oxygenase family protein [Gammaproteobacteria bacterium]|nr:2OG-Fe(II) oxygenase family protein [Gammaproteobacteria bacterium]
MKKWQRKTLQIDAKRIAVWPGKPALVPVGEKSIHSIVFDDIEHYHTALQRAILERENDPQYGLRLFRGACGVKVHHVDRWKLPAANLIHQRALALCSAVLGVEDPVCDISWANVYRNGDYCVPHSHRRTEASVVYLLCAGDTDDENPLGGRLCFADPRMRSCCVDEPGRVTNSVMPDMVPGMMIVFPSEAIHYVNPYTGAVPRITLSWNISSHRIAGSPNPQLDRQRDELRAQGGT